jgi:hypothetical protein
MTKFEFCVQQLYQITTLPGALRPRAACIARQQCKAMGAAELEGYSAYLAERHQQLVPNSGPTIVGACGTNAANILSIEADQLLRRAAVIETALAATQAKMARADVRLQPPANQVMNP